MNRLITTLALLCIFSIPAVSSALARAPFPSASRLQPIPEYVSPNISGNVNASLHAAAPETMQQEGIPVQEEAQDTTATRPRVPEQQASATQGLLLWFALFGVIALSVFAGLRYLLRG